MATRVTDAEVKEIFDTDITLDSFITAANQIVNRELENEGYNDAELKEIERWLSAHLATARDRQAVSKEMGEASVDYGTKKGLGLDQSEYGQFVKMLDKTGKLANLGQKKASISFIGSGS